MLRASMKPAATIENRGRLIVRAFDHTLCSERKQWVRRRTALQCRERLLWRQSTFERQSANDGFALEPAVPVMIFGPIG